MNRGREAAEGRSWRKDKKSVKFPNLWSMAGKQSVTGNLQMCLIQNERRSRSQRAKRGRYLVG